MSIPAAYSIIAFAYGGCLLAATFFWRTLPVPFLRTDDVMGVTFTLAAFIAAPFCITYTKYGLNMDQSEERTTENKERHRLLRRHCPIWPFAWYGCLSLVGASFVATAIGFQSVHEFYAFGAGISLLTGFWFMFAYPVARRLP